MRKIRARAVVDATGVERFPLIGISQGGPIAIAYATRHPERVSHLILYGSYARGKLARDLSAPQVEEVETLIKLIRLGWGRENPAFRQVFASMFIPDGTLEQYRWFNDLQRASASPENAARIVEGFNTIDVRHLAAQLNIPTLVLHARHDMRIPFEEGRLLASLIPGARLATLDSNNHILLEHEPAWPKFLSEVHEFLATPGSPIQNRPPELVIDPSIPIAPTDRLRTRHQLPAQLTPFIGRESELMKLRALIVADPVMAMHGIGKNIKYYGSDHVVWGTDCLWWGSPQWGIDALKRFQISDELGPHDLRLAGLVDRREGRELDDRLPGRVRRGATERDLGKRLRATRGYGARGDEPGTPRPRHRYRGRAFDVGPELVGQPPRPAAGLRGQRPAGAVHHGGGARDEGDRRSHEYIIDALTRARSARVLARLAADDARHSLDCAVHDQVDQGLGGSAQGL